MLGHTDMRLRRTEFIQALARIRIQFLAGGFHPGQGCPILRALLLHRLQSLLSVLHGTASKHIHLMLQAKQWHPHAHTLLSCKGHRLASVGDAAARCLTPLARLLQEAPEHALLLGQDAEALLVLVNDFAEVQAGVRYRFEHFYLGVQLRIRGYHMLVLLGPQLPLDRLLRDPELVLHLRLEHIFVFVLVLRSSFQLRVFFASW